MDLFAKLLRERVKELGLTSAEVARTSGLTERAFSHYMTGQREPNLQTLIRIARTLNTTPNDLLDVATGTQKPKGDEDRPRARIAGLCSGLDGSALMLVERLMRSVAEHEAERSK